MLSSGVALDVWPVESGLPILNAQVFVGPCLIVGVVMGEANGAVVVEIVLGVPIAEGQFR